MKLSAYTIAKNCSDISDVIAGISELNEYFMYCDMSGRKPSMIAYARLHKLELKKDKFKNK
jgi:hypothetical protein